MTRAQRLAGAALLLAASAGAMGVVMAPSAAAVMPETTSCSAMTISQGRGLNFDVSSVIVAPGGCVRFANLTEVTVTVTVSGSSFNEKLPPHTPAYASKSYTAYRSATATASDGVRTGHGTITVESAGSQPSAAPAPTTSTSTSSSTYVPPTSAPSGGQAGSGSGSAPPASGAAPIGPYSVLTQPAPGQSGGEVAVLPALPSLPHGSSSAPPTASHPLVAPRVKSSDPRYTSTVLEPVSGSGRGLPAAVAVVLLLGLASAYGRTVLIAAPAVDSARRARPLRPTV